MKTKKLDLVGPYEIAKLSGVSVQAVCNWRVRFQDFPKPLAELRMAPIWERGSIVRWLEAHGKI